MAEPKRTQTTGGRPRRSAATSAAWKSGLLASGFGAVFGLNVSPIPEVNIGVRYETRTALRWEYKDVSGPLAGGAFLDIAEGDKYDRDLPALLGLGVSCKPLEKLKVEGSLDYYFNQGADWDDAEDDVENGYAIGAAAEYALLEKLSLSAGFLYTKTGADEDSYLDVNPALNSFTVAGGVICRFTEKLSAELGIVKPFYTSDNGTSQDTLIDVDLEKSLWIIALGLQCKIF